MTPQPSPSLAAILALAVALLAAPPASAATPWPGETWSAAVDLTALAADDWSENLSGACWDPAARRLWVCTNGPAKFWSLREDGAGGFAVEREYDGTGDLEAIACLGAAADRVFVMDEQARTLRSYRIADGAALTSWLLSAIPDWGNSGPEGLAFVPDVWLARSGFVDGAGVPYPQSVHGASGFGGLVFVAVQTSGWVYAFDLRTDGAATFVGRYLTSRTESCELTFDGGSGRLYVLHNTDGNLIEITDLTSTPSGSARRFVAAAEIQVPSGSNIEGLAMTPAVTAGGAVGENWCFFTDDDADDGALRWFRQLHAGCAKVAGDGQSAEAGAAVSVAPSVRVRDPFANPLPGFAVAFAAASGGGAVTGGGALTGADGVATVGAWNLGPLPGPNTLVATCPGAAGSPLAFAAEALAPTTAAPDLLRDSLLLGAPTPNPGPAGQRIAFSLPQESTASLAVFDLRGRLVSEVARGEFAPGPHWAAWDGRRADGTPAPSGVYYYRLRAGDATVCRRGYLVR
ncbi:MAG: SdiA-regulated domain-containing protein [bacterium]|nr:SdiA-regulated domain-containing protein [bacterium]